MRTSIYLCVARHTVGGRVYVAVCHWCTYCLPAVAFSCQAWGGWGRIILEPVAHVPGREKAQKESVTSLIARAQHAVVASAGRGSRTSVAAAAAGAAANESLLVQYPLSMVLRSSGTDPAGAKAEPNRDSKLVFLAGCAGISSSNIASAIAAVTGDNPGNIRVYRKKDLDLRRVKMPSAASARTVLNAEQLFCNDREIRVNGWHPKPPPNYLGGEAAPADSSTDSEASVVSGKTTQTDMRDIEMRQHAIRLHGLASMLKDLRDHHVPLEGARVDWQRRVRARDD